MGTKYDYQSLKQQYIQTPGLSIRELCRRNNIPTWSTVQARANAEDWEQKRREFERDIESRSLVALAEKRARKVAEIQTDTLEVIHAGVLKMAEDMNAREPVMDGANIARDADGNIIWRPVMRFGVNQLETLVKQLLSLTGQPTQVTENRNLNASLSAEMAPDELRSLLAVLRPRAALAGSGGPAEAGDPSGSRSN